MTRLSQCFDNVYVVNLPDRKDRREHILRELASVALPTPNLTFYPAIRPGSAEGFPSIGARGCFLSHLSILKDALQSEGERFLVLEDDACFSPQFSRMEHLLTGEIAQSSWDLVYLGHSGVHIGQDSRALVQPYEGPVGTTVAYGITRSAAVRLVDYLD